MAAWYLEIRNRSPQMEASDSKVVIARWRRFTEDPEVPLEALWETTGTLTSGAELLLALAGSPLLNARAREHAAEAAARAIGLASELARRFGHPPGAVGREASLRVGVGRAIALLRTAEPSLCAQAERLAAAVELAQSACTADVEGSC